jgi:putative endopeptidase
VAKFKLFTSATLAARVVLAGSAASISKTQESSEPSSNPFALFASASTDRPAEPVTMTPQFGAWGFDISGLEPRAKPGDSFFDYANGVWGARTIIPADESRFGVFDISPPSPRAEREATAQHDKP